MNSLQRSAIAVRLPLALATIHVLLLIITVLLSANTPGGVFYRIVPVDLPWSMVLMATENWLTLGLFGALATGWWYFIGRIGMDSARGTMGRVSSGVGAMFIFLLVGVEVLGSIDPIKDDLRNGSLAMAAIIQYLIVGTLFIGALLGGISAAAAALRKRA